MSENNLSESRDYKFKLSEFYEVLENIWSGKLVYIKIMQPIKCLALKDQPPSQNTFPNGQSK